MRCEHVQIPGLGPAIICTSGRRRSHYCTACDQLAHYLCDWKTGDGKTCDLQICRVHAEQVAEEKHLCPKHSKAWAQWQAQRVLVLK